MLTLCLLLHLFKNSCDQCLGNIRVRTAVGKYIAGTTYENDFRKRYPGSWNRTEKCIVPGRFWFANWFTRMKKQNPTIKIAGSGKPTETTKLRYYTTSNINKWYDEAIGVLCDEWKIAKRTTDSDADTEITWTTNRSRVLFSDETACKDRKEAERIANKFRDRITE